MTFTYHFDWDPSKARINLTKHRIPFWLASTVLRDPLALTVYDEEHSVSAAEERWATLGQAENGQYLVVIHTFQHFSSTNVKVRIISARKADKQEIQNYEETPR